MADSGDEFSMKGQLYMEFGYVYETGVRERNEDALLLRNSLFAKGELILAAVCDGKWRGCIVLLYPGNGRMV